MADLVGSYPPRPINTTIIRERAVTFSQIDGELADSVGGNGPRPILTTRRPTYVVICSQVVDEIGFSAWYGEIVASR